MSTIVSAGPGWSLAVFVDGYPDEDSFIYDPIIAWDIERLTDADKREYLVTPILLNRKLEDLFNTRWLVRRPDGFFEVGHDASCMADVYENEADAAKASRELEGAVRAIQGCRTFEDAWRALASWKQSSKKVKQRAYDECPDFPGYDGEHDHDH
jgi:hypothetical protein